MNMQFDNLKTPYIFNMKVLNKETIFTSLLETRQFNKTFTIGIYNLL